MALMEHRRVVCARHIAQLIVRRSQESNVMTFEMVSLSNEAQPMNTRYVIRIACSQNML